MHQWRLATKIYSTQYNSPPLLSLLLSRSLRKSAAPPQILQPASAVGPPQVCSSRLKSPILPPSLLLPPCSRLRSSTLPPHVARTPAQPAAAFCLLPPQSEIPCYHLRPASISAARAGVQRGRRLPWAQERRRGSPGRLRTRGPPAWRRTRGKGAGLRSPRLPADARETRRRAGRKKGIEKRLRLLFSFAWSTGFQDDAGRTTYKDLVRFI
jgi:hypothetical protein